MTFQENFVSLNEVEEAHRTNELFKLLSKESESKEIRNFVLSKLKKSPEQMQISKSFQNYQYVNYEEEGISFCFDKINGKNFVLGAIHLYAKVNEKNQKQKFQEFLHEDLIPFGIHLKMDIKQIVEILGEPDKKGGSRLLPIWISYENIGLQFDFQGCEWNDSDNKIHFITVFQTKAES